MASNAKNERAMKVKTVLSDGRQLNTYFPLHCKLVLAQISIFKSYVIPSEPGDKRKDDQSIFSKVWPSLPVSVPGRMRKGKGLFMRNCITKSASMFDLWQKQLRLNLNNLHCLLHDKFQLIQTFNVNYAKIWVLYDVWSPFGFHFGLWGR